MHDGCGGDTTADDEQHRTEEEPGAEGANGNDCVLLHAGTSAESDRLAKDSVVSHAEAR